MSDLLSLRQIQAMYTHLHVTSDITFWDGSPRSQTFQELTDHHAMRNRQPHTLPVDSIDALIWKTIKPGIYMIEAASEDVFPGYRVVLEGMGDKHGLIRRMAEVMQKLADQGQISSYPGKGCVFCWQDEHYHNCPVLLARALITESEFVYMTGDGL